MTLMGWLPILQANTDIIIFFSNSSAKIAIMLKWLWTVTKLQCLQTTGMTTLELAPQLGAYSNFHCMQSSIYLEERDPSCIKLVSLSTFAITVLEQFRLAKSHLKYKSGTKSASCRWFLQRLWSWVLELSLCVHIVQKFIYWVDSLKIIVWQY